MTFLPLLDIPTFLSFRDKRAPNLVSIFLFLPRFAELLPYGPRDFRISRTAASPPFFWFFCGMLFELFFFLLYAFFLFRSPAFLRASVPLCLGLKSSPGVGVSAFPPLLCQPTFSFRPLQADPPHFPSVLFLSSSPTAFQPNSPQHSRGRFFSCPSDFPP